MENHVFWEEDVFLSKKSPVLQNISIENMDVLFKF